jgi:glycine reductase
MTPVAEMVGSPRIVPGNGIVHPMGDAERTPEEERRIRRTLVEKALAALGQPGRQ